MSHFIAVTDNYYGFGNTETEAIKNLNEVAGRPTKVYMIFSSETPITVEAGPNLLMQSDTGVQAEALVRWQNGVIKDRRDVPEEHRATGLPYELAADYVEQLQG